MGSGDRPNRSDVHLSPEQESELEAETRRHFDGIAPPRHTKPQRSDYSRHYTDALATVGDGRPIPEHLQFQRLETDEHKLVYAGSQVPEEFVGTEYYDDLSGVPKQHHTTGTGFIRVTEPSDGDGCFALAPDSATGCHAASAGNPATNDWIPAAAEKVADATEKPGRSEG